MSNFQNTGGFNPALSSVYPDRHRIFHHTVAALLVALQQWMLQLLGCPVTYAQQGALIETFALTAKASLPPYGKLFMYVLRTWPHTTKTHIMRLVVLRCK